MTHTPGQTDAKIEMMNEIGVDEQFLPILLSFFAIPKAIYSQNMWFSILNKIEFQS